MLMKDDETGMNGSNNTVVDEKKDSDDSAMDFEGTATLDDGADNKAMPNNPPPPAATEEVNEGSVKEEEKEEEKEDEEVKEASTTSSEAVTDKDISTTESSTSDTPTATDSIAATSASANPPEEEEVTEEAVKTEEAVNEDNEDKEASPTDKDTTNATDDDPIATPTDASTTSSTPTDDTTIDTATTEAHNDQQIQETALDHSLVAGDHVIRWEMLPIVWPIQVHGIVLEASPNYVTICDFGLTAQPRKEEDANDEKSETIIKETFWDKFKTPDNTKKERITVHIINTQEELKAWHKVNYGGTLFGLGGPAEGEEGYAASAGGVDGSGSPTNGKPPRRLNGKKFKEKVGPWWNKMRTSVAHNVQKNVQKIQRSREASRENSQASSLAESGGGAGSGSANNSTHSSVGSSSMAPATNFAALAETAAATVDVVTQSITPAASTSEDNDTEEKAANAKPSESKQADDEASSPANNKEPRKLPKSDPPKLVLARTRFLLEHGESVLPPYHVFHSNSECIAVFCKTGLWSTLQASVFLHSTAIGNAKSSMAVTLGVAASVPLLAPVIGGIGLAMVGAPYVILNQSKEKWVVATARLTEAFWAQAPNEVFVECIEHWSKLV